MAISSRLTGEDAPLDARPPAGEVLAPTPPRRVRARLAARAAGRVWAVRAATVLLWALVATSAVSGVAALLLQSREGTARSAPLSPPPSVGPQGFAELYVAAFLGEAGEGRESVLEPFYPGEVSLRGVTPAARYVARTVALDALRTGPGAYWSVTVAADLLTATEGGYRRDGVHYFRVGVLESGGGYVATSLPAEVPPPPRPALPRLRIGAGGGPAQEPAAEAGARFFAALLAGEGELGRYVSPGAQLRPLAPAPYRSVAVRRAWMQADESQPGSHLVQAEVEAVDAEGRRQVLHYFLRLTVREGRWEVAELLPGAPIAGPASIRE